MTRLVVLDQLVLVGCVMAAAVPTQSAWHRGMEQLHWTLNPTLSSCVTEVVAWCLQTSLSGGSVFGDLTANSDDSQRLICILLDFVVRMYRCPAVTYILYLLY